MIAIVGCGAWGRNLVRNFKALNALHMVVDNRVRGRLLAQQLAPEAQIRDDVAFALDDPRVTAIAIATPSTTHAHFCRVALSRGKDVFCEKPLALDVDAARGVAEQAVAGARILMVGHILEYHPAFLELRRIVGEGRLGRIRHIQATRLHPLVGDGDLDSVLWTLAPHDIAVVLRLFGAIPHRVIGRGSAWKPNGMPGVATVRLEFADAVADLCISGVHHFKEQRLIVAGSDATLSFDDVRDEMYLYGSSSQGCLAPIPMDAHAVPFAHVEPLAVECRAFLDAIRSRRPPLSDGQSAVDVLSVVAAAEQSVLGDGRPIAL